MINMTRSRELDDLEMMEFDAGRTKGCDGW